MATERHITLCGRKLDRPGHICAFFDSRTEEYDVLAPYFLEGLSEGEEVINIVDADRVTDHQARLESHGVPVKRALANGNLKVLTSEDTYTSGGRFAAERMYEMLQAALAEAQWKQKRVRTSGVMDWTTRGHAGTEELMVYEARVNVLVPIYDCTLLCVYDLNEISGKMMMDVLMTHPYVIRERRIIENQYYVPPIEVLKQTLRADTGHATGAMGLPAS